MCTKAALAAIRQWVERLVGPGAAATTRQRVLDQSMAEILRRSLALGWEAAAPPRDALDRQVTRAMKPSSASASLAPTSCVTWSSRVKGRSAGEAAGRLVKA